MNQHMVNLFFARSEGLRRQAQAVRQTVDQGMTLVFEQMGVWLQANISKTFAVVDQELVIPDPILDKSRNMAYQLGLGHAFDEGFSGEPSNRREFLQIFRITRRAHFRAIRGIRHEASNLCRAAKQFRKKIPAELRPKSAFAA
ncbi:MAG: hypothetical protein A2835_02540 [Candidatus Niyogibacteria bacterium RIFCSPHIGHO2_01_FULL_45_28]|uniref:Uncharacterized protein n=2 Tax=Candidatus Niyogiibacteriota TaxID=1817912 RepID=A0A1G2F272_9BACT|nr:MAG: hypothetical protein A2835_02540 [Candidatus Niyogibacteria bacterium RIFCSPHIGHO2_01_FULL_45_28]OGZ31661.1 MAG: hypothetical protein A3J00_00425 [Candidatus Niyogibacteria bacterium RIFCSPLOWO2_02_FULL_45_13]